MQSPGLHAIKADRKRQAAWRPYYCSSFMLAVKQTQICTNTCVLCVCMHTLTNHCILMTLALGTFVWGLASHPYTRTHTPPSNHATTPPPPSESPPPLALSSPAPSVSVKQLRCNGNVGLADTDKGDVEWQASTEDCVQRVRALGGEMVDDACQSVSPWITLLPTWESATSLSVYLYIWFELLSATKSLFSPIKAERKLSAPQR